MRSHLAFTIAAALICTSSFAQEYPARPIHVVVPFSAGGGSDIVARVVAPKMSEILGQPIVIENRTGAGGNIGAEYVAKSKPDGYTLLMAAVFAAINTTLIKNLPWDLLKDFTPVVLLVTNQSLLVAHPSVPVSSVKDLLALAKAKPGQVTYASYGNGSQAHLVAELFKMTAGVDLLHVPYKGAAPAVNDLVGGQVNVMFADIGTVLPQVKAGKVRALGIASLRRFEGLPNVPTISEAGVPGFEGGGFLGLAAPAGTPRAAVLALNAAANKSLDVPEVHERLVELATFPIGGSPERFGQHLRAEIDKWARVIRAGNIKAD